jgi:hypothetical protein
MNKYLIVIYKLHPSQCFPAFKTNQQYIIFVTLITYVSMLLKKNLIYRVLPALEEFVESQLCITGSKLKISLI